tara:strand:+ start:1118 stop:1795 length:678 start_codon:yes stop_codon:yes gene_type:complete
MTTILITKDHIYCDTRCSQSSTIVADDVIKFFPLSTGAIAIGAGSVPNIVASLAIFEGHGRKHKLEDLVRGPRSKIIIVHPDGFIDTFKPNARGSGAAEHSRLSNTAPTLFWSGIVPFETFGSGSDHVKAHMEYVDEEPLNAMKNAARKDSATSNRVFVIPRRWNDGELKVKFHDGLTANGKHRKAVEATVDFPENADWVYEVLTGQRDLHTPELVQATVGKGKK